MDSNERRSYVSPRREEAARVTRRAVLAAAHELFVANGFGATTIDQIAERAGVSRPTVFTAVGNKGTLLKEVRDLALAGDDEPVPLAERPEFREALDEPDPVRAVRFHARNMTAVNARSAALLEVMRGAADSEPGVRDLWATSERERLTAARSVVKSLQAKGGLAPGLDAATAADLVWALMAPEAFVRLVGERGWSVARYQEWLGNSLAFHLLPPKPPKPPVKSGRRVTR
jgi:AcrR family transcriptional regulator